MKIVNRTHWQTAPLARIARRVLTLEVAGRPERKRRVNHLTLTIGYNKGNGQYFKHSGSSGCAWLNGNTLNVNIPSHKVDALDFAFVVGHELGHVWGMNHSDMNALHYERGGPANARYAWAKSIPIVKVAKKAKPTSDAKLLHAQKMLKHAHTRAKRAATLVKKWQAKVRYYERQQVAGLKQAAVTTPTTEG